MRGVKERVDSSAQLTESVLSELDCRDGFTERLVHSDRVYFTSQ